MSLPDKCRRIIVCHITIRIHVQCTCIITVLQMIFHMDGHFQTPPIAVCKIVTVYL